MAKQTAAELYNERREGIARVMDWIELELDKHKANAKSDPADWGYAGDLGHVRKKLIETLAFLSNGEPQDIEDLLSECRRAFFIHHPARRNAMKKDQIKVGQVYVVKVTGKIVPVKIDAENPGGGWDGTNIHTNRPVRIKSAQRLRNRVSVPGPDDEAKAIKDARTETKRDTGEPRAKGGKRDADGEKPTSLLDAAAHLLSLGTGDPMRCKDIVDLAVDRGLWQPGTGKTPANTLYAAILREIMTKGEASRFMKAERGKFTLAKKR